MIQKQKKLNKIFEQYTEEKGFEFKLLKYKTAEVIKYTKGPRVLDIGCGVGILTKSLGEKFAEVVGIDGSDVKIDVAKKYNSLLNVDYQCVMFDDYQPTKLFDTAIMTNVIEHIEDPLPFLKMVKSWLKTNGRIIATLPNALAFHKRLGKEMGLITDYYTLTKSDIAKGHYINYDANILKKTFKKAGLHVVFNGGIFFKPFSSTQMEIYNDKILDGLYQIGQQFPDLCSGLIIVGEKR